MAWQGCDSDSKSCRVHLQVRQEYGVKKDLLGLLEGRETYVIGKDGIVKLVSPAPSVDVEVPEF